MLQSASIESAYELSFYDYISCCSLTQDHKSIAGFIAYALCSTNEALRDANWVPGELEKERMVLALYAYNFHEYVRFFTMNHE